MPINSRETGITKEHWRQNWDIFISCRFPCVTCQCSHHDVICLFSILEKFQRFWLDLQQDAFFSSGLGQSLRAIRSRWSGQLGSSLGLRAINELINQVEPLVHRMREQHFPEAPTVVQCDGIWVTGKTPEGRNQDRFASTQTRIRAAGKKW